MVIQRWRSEREKCLILLASGGDCELHNEEPEDLREVISAYQKCVAETVGRFGGLTGCLTGGFADRAGPPCPDAEACLAWPTHRRDRARNQKPAQFRQQLLGGFCRTDRRIAGSPWQSERSTLRRAAEIAELTDTLRDNLDKIVQHGKRADAIVKNMLLHSREGSGEHRPVDVNALVEESLNLAYHGARAEKQGFKITLERSFDPAAGQVDVYPQEITRALLNLISNGFYAATKRKEQDKSDRFEPSLMAATKNLGDKVEIRIRDNGLGIPPEVKEKMFNPFFTTKPAGEGTGLGLSITHDIIVKQHSGSIEVDTQPGEFTEIRIILPRTATFIAESGGRA